MHVHEMRIAPVPERALATHHILLPHPEPKDAIETRALETRQVITDTVMMWSANLHRVMAQRFSDSTDTRAGAA